MFWIHSSVSPTNMSAPAILTRKRSRDAEVPDVPPAKRKRLLETNTVPCPELCNEVWCHIASYLVMPIDYWSLCGIAQRFQGVLKSPALLVEMAPYAALYDIIRGDYGDILCRDIVIFEAQMSHDLYVYAVRLNWRRTCEIPKLHLTADLLSVAMIASGGAILESMLDSTKTDAICDQAIELDAQLICYLPLPMRTLDRCERVVRKYGKAIGTDVPEPMRTQPLKLLAVQQDGLALGTLSDPEIDIQLCLAAIEQTMHAAYYIPIACLTTDLCMTILNELPYFFSRVPMPLRTDPMRLLAVTKHGKLLEQVTPSKRGHSLCCAAIRQACQAAAYVPDASWDEDLSYLMLELYGYVAAGRYGPSRLRTPSFYRRAVHKDPQVFNLFPAAKQTNELARLALALRSNRRYGAAIASILVSE